MQQLFYADEVRSAEEIELDKTEVKEPEIQLALQLIAQTTSADGFHPERYRDAVKQRIEEAIERKVAGQEIQVASPEPQAQVIDLMDALKKSIGAGRAPAAAEPPVAPKVALAPPLGDEGKVPERKPPRRAPREQAHRATSRK
jgi:DNA end-binding protein Ku